MPWDDTKGIPRVTTPCTLFGCCRAKSYAVLAPKFFATMNTFQKEHLQSSLIWIHYWSTSSILKWAEKNPVARRNNQRDNLDLLIDVHTIREALLLKPERYLGDGEKIEDGKEISNKVLPGGFLWLWGLGGEAIAAEIRSDGLESCLGNCIHLVPPRVPYLWKSMDEEHSTQFPYIQQHRKRLIRVRVLWKV